MDSGYRLSDTRADNVDFECVTTIDAGDRYERFCCWEE
jgi:hypothetical protein